MTNFSASGTTEIVLSLPNEIDPFSLIGNTVKLNEALIGTVTQYKGKDSYYTGTAAEGQRGYDFLHRYTVMIPVPFEILTDDDQG